MGINVGSVEAVLAARDTMSPVFVAAAERVLELKNAIKAMGSESGPAIERLRAELALATTEFIRLKEETLKGNIASSENAAVTKLQTESTIVNTAAMAAQNTTMATAATVNGAVAASLTNVTESSVVTEKALNNLEGMATRLVTRMAILYAIRGTFEFVKDLYTAADALEHFHDNLGVSLTLLQQLQYAGTQTDVPFEKITTGLGFFEKALAQAKATTGDALLDIGLSFSRLKALSPDDQITATMNAIAEMGDKSARVRVEIALFGQDIDDLVMKQKGLRQQALDTNKVIDDETVQGMANASRAYKSAGVAVEEFGSKIFFAFNKGVEFMASPWFIWWSTGQLPKRPRDAFGDGPGSPDFAFNNSPVPTHAGADINLPAGGVGDGNGGHGAEILAGLDAQLKSLNAEQRSYLEGLKQRGELTADMAAKDDISTAQFKQYTKAMSDGTAAQKAFNTEEEKTIRGDQSWLNKRIDDWEREGVAEYNATEKEIRDNQRLLDALISDLQRRTDAETDSLDRLQLLHDKYNQAVQLEYGNSTDIAIANIHRQADAEIKALKENDVRKKEDIEIIRATEAQAIQAYIHNLDPLWQAWKAGNEDMRKEWADSWLAFENDPSIKNLVSALSKPFDDIETQFKKMLAGMLSDYEQQLLAPILGGMRQMMGGLFSSMSGGGSPTDYIGDDVNSVAGISGKMSNATRYGGGALMAGAGIFQMATNRGAMSDIMGGAEAGAGIGTMIMPGLGTAIGAGIGAFVGGVEAMMSRDHTASNVAKAAGEQFGQKWSDALQKSIVDRSNAKGGFHDTMTAELASLPDIIKEHPIDASNLDMYEGKVHDIFSMIQTGHFTVQQGSEDLNSVFPSLATAATDAYGRITDKLKEIISLNEQYATKSQAIADWQKTQGMNVLGGFGAVAGALLPDDKALAADRLATLEKQEDVAARIADLEAKKKKSGLTNVQTEQLKDLYEQRTDLSTHLAGIDSTAHPNAQNLGDLGSMAVGSFVTAAATGTSKSDALKAESSALTALEAEYKRLGITVNDTALKSLFMMNNIQKQAPTLIAGIEGLGKEIVGLDNLNQETTEGFEAQERIGEAMYDRLKTKVNELGGDAADALIPMQDYLHIAADEAAKLHTPLDANTQEMIDQSKALGIWDANAKPVKTTTEKLADAVERLVNWLDRIPASTDTDVNVNEHHHTTFDGNPPSNDGFDPNQDQNQNQAQGGIIQARAFGGRITRGRILPFRIAPGSTDTELVAMTPNEGVVTTQGMNRIGHSGLTAINSGAGLDSLSSKGSGTSINVAFSINVYAQNGVFANQQMLETTITKGVIKGLSRGEFRDFAKLVARANKANPVSESA